MATTHKSTDNKRAEAAFLFPPQFLRSDWVTYFEVMHTDSWRAGASSGTIASGEGWVASTHSTEWTLAFGTPVTEHIFPFQQRLPHLPATESFVDSWFVISRPAVELPGAIDELRDGHTLRDERAVLSFLDEHAQVLPVLLEGRCHIARLFGVDASVELDVVIDPESDGYRQLFAYIVTSGEPGDVLERLNRFDEEWFLGKIAVVGDLLCFSPVIR